MPFILFSSPKGGVGKTTLTAHVAASLAARGYRVMALDLDPQNALRLHLGLSIREEGGFAVTADTQPDWRAAVMETPAEVKLLPFGAADPRRVLELGAALFANPDLLTAPLREMLADPTQVVVADSQPGASALVTAAMPLVDLAVIVMMADAGSASLLPQVVSGRVYGRGTLAARMADRAAVAINQVDLDSPLSATVLDSAAQMLGPRLLGAICRDDAVAEALADRRLVAEDAGGAGEDLAMLAEAVVARLKLRLPGAPANGFAGLADWGLA